MRPLIVPVNFSECAACAARYAADLKKYTSDKVSIFTSVAVGNVFSQVEELCQNIHPYAIILGSSGPTFEKFIAGSQIGALLHLPYPVLIVPERETFNSFSRIVLACDSADLASGLPHSLPLIEELRKRFDAQIDVVTVGDNRNTTNEESYLQSISWQDRFKQLQPHLHTIQGKNIEEGLFHFLADNPADLVVVFPKNHNFLEFHTRQSKKIAKHSAIPVMSIHE